MSSASVLHVLCVYALHELCVYTLHDLYVYTLPAALHVRALRLHSP